MRSTTTREECIIIGITRGAPRHYEEQRDITRNSEYNSTNTHTRYRLYALQ